MAFPVSVTGVEYLLFPHRVRPVPAFLSPQIFCIFFLHQFSAFLPPPIFSSAFSPVVEDEPTWVAKKVFNETRIAITCCPMSRDETDKEGELVALDYDTDTSKGERAVKVATTNVFSLFPLI